MRTSVRLRAPLVVAALALALVTSCTRKEAAAGGLRAPDPTPATAEQVLAMTKDPSAKAIIVNVWASWCAPCREELPALARLQHERGADGLKVILVSADDPKTTPTDKLVEYMGTQGIDFPTWIKEEGDKDFMKAMTADWSGAIPATFVYTPDGQLFDFWEGKATYSTFEQKADEVIAAGAAPAAG